MLKYTVGVAVSKQTTAPLTGARMIKTAIHTDSLGDGAWRKLTSRSWRPWLHGPEARRSGHSLVPGYSSDTDSHYPSQVTIVDNEEMIRR